MSYSVLCIDGRNKGELRSVSTLDSFLTFTHQQEPSVEFGGHRISPVGIEQTRYYIHPIAVQYVDLKEAVQRDRFVTYDSSDVGLLKWMGKTKEVELKVRAIWYVASIHLTPPECRSSDIVSKIRQSRCPSEVEYEHTDIDQKRWVLPADFDVGEWTQRKLELAIGRAA
jgi:hypothetical protein